MNIRKNIVYATLFNATGDQLLMVENRGDHGDYYTLPGGTVERDETLHTAITREVLEETGYHLTPGNIVHVAEAFFPQAGEHCLFFFFAGEITSGQLKTNVPEEISGLVWMDREEAFKHLNLPEASKESLFAGRTVPYDFAGEIIHA
ncbi:NUDIX domain-containing protein [Exiguobacterium sp. Leaf196]|uniref:NUDIX domain-containing protein n=1 Tax=Exiguobacterium sp. Leaf196 TaxID=1736298 RepID=UPI0009EA12D0|nr:NUDIX hydrolase [Exiguobacterium sp. Leaf196]